MKKILSEKGRSNLFTASLVTWFVSTIYLNINYMVGFFINTDPYIAKFLSVFSFISLVAIGAYNYSKTGDLANPTNMLNVGNQKSTPGTCKTCKSRRK